MRLAALVLAMVLIPAPQGAEMKLGDFGTITYPDIAPNTARITSTIEFVFSLFPDVDVPPTTIRIMPLGEYEEYLARLEAGPMWQQWLISYRSQTNGAIAATTDRKAAEAGRLLIVTHGELPDMILIHEALHFVARQLSPTPPDEHPVINTEATVRAMTSSIMVSKRYRAYLRDRPWAR